MGFSVIAGLGNPGREYEDTRHNAGFILVDSLFRKFAPKSGWRERFDALFAELEVEGKKIFAVKPQRFMNVSGEPLREFLSYYKIPPEELIVVHDDLDIPLGSLRIKMGGGSGGHNGIESISQHIGTAEFVRLRIGIGRPPYQGEGVVSRWVLGRFASDEKNVFDGVIPKGIDALVELLSKGILAAQNKFNA